MKIRPYYILPIVVFIGMAIFLFVGLGLNPRETAFPLYEQAPPDFALGPLHEDQPGLTDEDLLGDKTVVLNFFASWCAPCREEHPYLMALSERDDINVYGIDYREVSRQKAIAWLYRDGNPFELIGYDQNARVGMEWGLAGVPETFIVHNGKVIRRYQGPLNAPIMQHDLLPLLEALAE